MTEAKQSPAGMTSRELIRWSRLSERRAGGVRGELIALLLGAAFAGWVVWRQTASPVAGSHAWLAGTLVVFAFAFLRVPFLMYWRADASLLAQLPIEGEALFDAALARCVSAAIATTVVAVIGAVPLLDIAPELALRHAAFALALGLAAALLLPAVVVWSASLVAAGAMTAVSGGQQVSASATLGAIPGFAATGIIVPMLIASPWLVGGEAKLPGPAVLGAVAALSVLGIVVARAGSAKVMTVILRDVSALDRQRLATLEIRPATALERGIARLLGEAALPYDKTARLIRRRYPLAFALGAVVFLVLAIVGLARASEPAWMTGAIVSAAIYAVVLASRLGRPPLDLPRLALPISHAALRRARRAWLVAWWTIFVLAPGLFAALRTEPAIGAALLGAGTLLVLLV